MRITRYFIGAFLSLALGLMALSLTGPMPQGMNDVSFYSVDHIEGIVSVVALDVTEVEYVAAHEHSSGSIHAFSVSSLRMSTHSVISEHQIAKLPPLDRYVPRNA